MSTDHKGRKVINPFNTHHVIIDLETFDTSSRAAIFAIGIVILAPDLQIKFTGEYILSNPFNNPASDSRFGNYKVSTGTVDWWLSEEQEAARLYLEDRWNYDSMGAVLTGLNYVIKQCPENDFLVYGNPSDFDIPILVNAYSKNRIKLPWNYHQSACIRTLSRLIAQEVKDEIKFEGIPHTPLADALHEAKSLSWAIRYIKDLMEGEI